MSIDGADGVKDRGGRSADSLRLVIIKLACFGLVRVIAWLELVKGSRWLKPCGPAPAKS